MFYGLLKPILNSFQSFFNHKKLISLNYYYLILTRKCFTIAIKTIQLSSHLTQHDEFIKATFSSEIFFETNNIFAIRGKSPFLFHYVREDKKLNRVKLPYAILQKNKFQDQTVSMKNLFLE